MAVIRSPQGHLPIKAQLCVSHGARCLPHSSPRRPTMASGHFWIVRMSRTLAAALTAALDANSTYGHHEYATGTFCEREPGCRHGPIRPALVAFMYSGHTRYDAAVMPSPVRAAAAAEAAANGSAAGAGHHSSSSNKGSAAAVVGRSSALPPLLRGLPASKPSKWTRRFTIDSYMRRGLLKASEHEALIAAKPNALYHPIKCEYNQGAGLDALWWAEHSSAAAPSPVLLHPF